MSSSSLNLQNAPDDPELSLWSCFVCRRRKVRCDRHNPCLNCTKGGLECAFPVSGRVPTRRHDPTAVGSSKKKQMKLLGKLRRLEGLVEELSAQVEGEPNGAREVVIPSHNATITHASSDDAAQQSNISSNNVSDLPTSESASAEHSRNQDLDAHASIAQSLGKLILGKDGSYYVGNRLWGVLASEVKKIREALEEEEPFDLDLDVQLDEGELPGANFRIPFSWNLGAFERKALQPLPSQVPFIWQIFQDNVDLLVKVLHVPTVSQVIKDSKGKFDALSHRMEALMFAISFAAVTCLSESEVLDNFGETKGDLVARLRLGTEQALSHAGLLNTTAISVVQAFTIYLEAASRLYGNRATWIMAGLVVRTSISMGLHRDGSQFLNVSPFNAEIRRRLCWQICLIDGQVGDCEVSQLAVSEKVFNTREPSNYNDVDLVPSMKEMPPAREGFTDSTFFIIRCELWRLNRKLQAWLNTHKTSSGKASESFEAVDPKQMLEMVQGFKMSIKTRHLRHLDPSDPLHIFIRATTVIVLTNLDLIIRDIDNIRAVHRSEIEGLRQHGPSSSFCPCRRPTSFLRALAQLECLHLLRTDPAMQRWAWSLHSAMQWNAVRVLLIQLYVREWGPVCERAWAAVNRSFEDTTDVRLNKSLWHPAFGLMAAVRKHREQEIRRLRASPDVALRLRSMARLHPGAVVLDSLQQLGEGVEFDTRAAEDRLAVETTLSTGGGCEMNPIANDAELISVDDVDWILSNWVDVNPDQQTSPGFDAASSGVTFSSHNVDELQLGGNANQPEQQLDPVMSDPLGTDLKFDLGIMNGSAGDDFDDPSWMQILNAGGSRFLSQHFDGNQPGQVPVQVLGWGRPGTGGDVARDDTGLNLF